MKRKAELAATKDIATSEAETAKAKYEELFNQHEAADHSLKSEEQNLIVLQHQQKASEAEIDKVKEELSYTIITSSINGVITKQKTEVGEQVVPGVQGSFGSTILEVADFSQMLMVARIDEANIAAVKPKQKAITRAFRYPSIQSWLSALEGLASKKPSPEPSKKSTSMQDSTFPTKPVL